MTKFELSYDELAAAQNAFDVSALNGILMIVSGLRGRGLFTDAQIASLQQTMVEPLVAEAVRANPIVQHKHEYLNGIFEEMLRPSGG